MLLGAIRAVPGLAWLLDRLVGFRRPFFSYRDAEAAARRFLASGHSHSANAQLHLDLSQRPRPSDYPVLFHLGRIPNLRSVFDLGGNVGNLFYCYDGYLHFPASTTWKVLDVDAIRSIGEDLARQRGETRLQFVADIGPAGNPDVLLVSGALHYFEQPLPEMLAALPAKPPHVIINRTPLSERETLFAVQDAGEFLVACQLHRRADLIAGMLKLGYRLADEWTVPELSLQFPAQPDLSVDSYSGLYFQAG